jgi:hypothetical protein
MRALDSCREAFWQTSREEKQIEFHIEEGTHT